MERRSVAVYPILPGSPPRILLLRRIPQRGGKWQPVTGRVEAGEGLAEAARRELVEETGLAARALIDLDLETRFVGYDGHRYHERAFAAVIPDAPARLSGEHEEARVVPLAEAEALLFWEENRAGARLAARRLREGGWL